jgi:hypothetical protein
MACSSIICGYQAKDKTYKFKILGEKKAFFKYNIYIENLNSLMLEDL